MMTQIINGVMLLLSSSLAASILGKASRGRAGVRSASARAELPPVAGHGWLAGDYRPPVESKWVTRDHRRSDAGGFRVSIPRHRGPWM
jgi:hypothetical protein